MQPILNPRVGIYRPGQKTEHKRSQSHKRPQPPARQFRHCFGLGTKIHGRTYLRDDLLSTPNAAPVRLRKASHARMSQGAGGFDKRTISVNPKAKSRGA